VASITGEALERFQYLTWHDAVVVLGVAALVGAIAWAALSIVESMRRNARTLQRLHLQQENIIAMLLKAGFRPAHTLDWGDNADGTRPLNDPALTQFDWRDPE
jgi:hypothetical protein